MTNYEKELLASKEYQKAILTEAKNLRKHATKEEINNLVISTLDHSSMSSCVYGQMTGNCESTRAQELMFKCCNNVMTNRFAVNGKLTKEMLKKRENSLFNIPFLTPVEVYIATNLDPMGNWEQTSRKRAKALVNFLKGKRDDLIFN